MSGLGCCTWWFLSGALLGWLVGWLLDRLIGKGPADASQAAAPTAGLPTSATQPPDGIDGAAARAAGFVVGGIDNLEVIEGIGPVIANLLRNNGVTSFATLSSMSQPAIREILDSAGLRFQIANPATWPEQAALAAANRWADLRRLQDELEAGVHPA